MASCKQWEGHITCLRGGGVVTDRWGVKGVLISNSDLDQNCTKQALHWIIIYYYLVHIGPAHYSNPAIRHDSPLSLL